jgi:hypoxanthine phosphoribosyltransferase
MQGSSSLLFTKIFLGRPQLSTPHPQQLLEQAELIHSSEIIDAAISRLGDEISTVLQHENPIVLCVVSGGIVFTGQLLTRFDFPLQLDYVHASRYRNATVGMSLVWDVLPKLDLTNRTILLVDDILDQGITLKAIQNKCFELGAAKVFSAVLVEKRLTQAKPITADFVGLEVPDRYVFGYGMDVYGWWRNLPAIYALKTT